MKAAVMHKVGELLSIRELPVPQIGPDEALVEVRTSGICGTDLHILAGHGYIPALPHVLGHEPAGVVIQTGSRVKGIKPGDHVVPHLFFSCNQCFYCLAGREQQCANLQGILGVLCPGAFAEYFKAPAENLFPLPESVPFDAGGLIADAVLTGLHAVRRAALQQGDSAAVLGAGGVGQIIIQILASSGVRVAAIDRLGEKLGIARDFGAEAVFDSTEETARPVIEFSGRGGVNCVFNCVGTPESMRLSADMIMRCGRIVVIGEEPGDAPLNTIEIAQRELEIIGSRNGTRREMAEAIQLVAEGVVRPYIAARFPLEDINQAFDCVRHGALGRVVVVIKD